MGNDQSSPSGSVSARNPKTSVGSQAQSDRAVGPQMRCVRSAQSTPRLGDPPPVPPVAYHHQKSSDSLLDGRFPCGGADSSRESSTPQHRLSTDDNGGVGHSALERRPSRGKMALSATQSTTLKDAQHARRIEKAASQFATTGDFGLSLAEQLKLSHHHINLLVQTWPRLHGSQSIFLEVFKTLMKSNNAAREIFQKMSIVEGFTSAGGKKSCDLKEHARLLAELFDYCIKNMQRPAKLVQEKCLEIGAAHLPLNGRGMSGTMWDQLGDCMAELITRNESVRTKREAVKAWIPLVSFVVDSIKSGYQTEVKRRNTIQGTASVSTSSASATIARRQTTDEAEG